MSCEETEAIPDATNGLLQRHGYVFEVDPYDEDANLDPQPLKFLGRFEHEAVAVDPDTHVIYETEDATAPNGLFYRWTPPDAALPLEKGSLRALPENAGTLEAMRASSEGVFVPDLSVVTEPGTTFDVEWVAVPERDAAESRCAAGHDRDAQPQAGGLLVGRRRSVRRRVVRPHR